MGNDVEFENLHKITVLLGDEGLGLLSSIIITRPFLSNALMDIPCGCCCCSWIGCCCCSSGGCIIVARGAVVVVNANGAEEVGCKRLLADPLLLGTEKISDNKSLVAAGA